MEPLEMAAAQGLAIWVNRHDRKTGGELGDAGRGSSAFSGAADVLLALKRANTPGHETRRVLQGVGRFDDVPEQIMLELREGRYVDIGSAMEVERADAKARIFEALPGIQATPATEAELVAIAECSRSTGRRALEELVTTRIALRTRGAGSSGRAFGYQLNELSNRELDPERLNSSHGSEDGVPSHMTSPHTPGHMASGSEMSSLQSLIGHSEWLTCHHPSCSAEVAYYDDTPEGHPWCEDHGSVGRLDSIGAVSSQAATR